MSKNCDIELWFVRSGNDFSNTLVGVWFRVSCWGMSHLPDIAKVCHDLITLKSLNSGRFSVIKLIKTKQSMQMSEVGKVVTDIWQCHWRLFWRQAASDLGDPLWITDLRPSPVSSFSLMCLSVCLCMWCMCIIFQWVIFHPNIKRMKIIHFCIYM